MYERSARLRKEVAGGSVIGDQCEVGALGAQVGVPFVRRLNCTGAALRKETSARKRVGQGKWWCVGGGGMPFRRAMKPDAAYSSSWRIQ